MKGRYGLDSIIYNEYELMQNIFGLFCVHFSFYNFVGQIPL